MNIDYEAIDIHGVYILKAFFASSTTLKKKPKIPGELSSKYPNWKRVMHLWRQATWLLVQYQYHLFENTGHLDGERIQNVLQMGTLKSEIWRECLREYCW